MPLNYGNAVTRIDAMHRTGFSDEDLEAIFIDRVYELTFVPRNFSSFSENIKAYKIEESSIKFLNGDEFDEYPRLEYLTIGLSKIKAIPSKLFEKTLELKFIGFFMNEIKKVGHDLFTKFYVENLRQVDFRQNFCIDENAKYSDEILSLIENLKEKCPYDDETTTTTILATTTKEIEKCFYWDRQSETVTEVTGRHQSSNTNDDVKTIKIETTRTFSFFPQGLGNFFPNVIAINIRNTNIEILTGEELDEFPQLRSFVFVGSNLTTISSKLFEKTPNIEFISFSGNKLEKIGRDLFKPINVTQLKELYFNNNFCINRHENVEIFIKELINELKEKCPFDDEFTTTTLATTTTMKKKCFYWDRKNRNRKTKNEF
ncbi:hypothetical protein PVAND_016315 [Polypedilum vanderplanki]|uniref:Uncharacterized protein n=1 Tax=Polypedilum vanderplanki TaxID=319348 RepID=A0A9J6BFV7_POLVA|nr:hypothetical protein PVAND_016315 [Polypedilum vanderplanki]